MGTMFPNDAEAHPLTRLVLILTTPQSAALVVTASLMAVAMCIFSDRTQANRTENHWDEVCRQVLRDRDGVDHQVLAGAAGDDGMQQVRCCLLSIAMQVIGCRRGAVGSARGRWAGW